MSIFSKFFKRFLGKKQIRVLLVGLDNSGKTTIVNQLKPKKVAAVETVPTIGFSIEEFKRENINFTVFDMSGQSRYRNLWEHYYDDTQAIIYVIDSSDRFRMVVVKDELSALLLHKSVKKNKAPVLFYANKMDIHGSMSPVEMAKELELDKISEHNWHLTPSDALKGEGIAEGISWLTEQLK